MAESYEAVEAHRNLEMAVLDMDGIVGLYAETRLSPEGAAKKR